MPINAWKVQGNLIKMTPVAQVVDEVRLKVIAGREHITGYVGAHELDCSNP